MSKYIAAISLADIERMAIILWPEALCANDPAGYADIENRLHEINP